MRRTVLFLALAVVLLLLASRALAMSSAHYRLDWFTPLTGGGGGRVSSVPASSVQCVVNFTVGQSAIGAGLHSANYQGCLGYWCGAGGEHPLFLPLTLRNY